MKHTLIAIILLASACGSEQEPVTRVEYVEQPATTTSAVGLDTNAVVPASPLPVEPAASPLPTPAESAMPAPTPSTVADSTPQDANSATQQVQPTPVPSPTPSATPACSQTAQGVYDYTCGVWVIAPIAPGQWCVAGHAALWTLAPGTDAYIPYSKTMGGPAWAIDGYQCNSGGSCNTYVAIHNTFCYATISPAPND